MSTEANTTPDRTRLTILILTLITTVFSAILAGLQADASIRASEANTESQYYAVLTSAELVRQGQESAYDLATLARALQNSQESLILEFSALELDVRGNNNDAKRLRDQAQTAQTRAQAAYNLSVFYTNPRYAPQEEGNLPDTQTYINDKTASANALVEQQNNAADAYHRWDEKSDSYLTILTLLALVFFLLGVAQTTSRLRIVFAGLASLILIICAVWTLLVLFT
jgi:hypothetical protein